MATEYVQHRDGNIYVGPSRVTIDSVIINWQAGRTPEQIHESFPTVPLAYIYGTIAHYLEHQEEIDAWLREGEELWRRGWEDTRKTHAGWFARNRARLGEIGVEEHADPSAEDGQERVDASLKAPEPRPS
jgi:uncharacterized protein (DUF433 family)